VPKPNERKNDGKGVNKNNMRQIKEKRSPTKIDQKTIYLLSSAGNLSMPKLRVATTRSTSWLPASEFRSLVLTE
jgi:hypothetical protein